ncbi:hypothetical protein KR026_008340 [Drosophila bipectinata]|nr:hypothetical protein KR026_008340 [Drosophila bipectinata]
MFGRCSLLFMAVLLASTASIQSHFPEYCAECEQEVWEQVPCSEVPTTPAPTTAGTTSATTTRPGTTSVPTTTEIPYPPSPEPPTPDYTTPQTPYKKCYCECKLGCKEFCRKVVSSDPQQPLTQISSIGEYAPGGQVEFSHVHQRKFVPKYGGDGYAGLVGPVGGPKSYKPYPLVYEEQAASATPSPAVANIAAPNFSLEELAQLLSNAYGGKKSYSAPSPLPSAPSVYYSPVYNKQTVPVISKVLPAPKRSSKILVSAVASSSGVSLAKIKTPYEEKLVVATQPPSYDQTTSYPIVEEPKVYIPSQTEAYPIVPSHTESYPSPAVNYPSITESYPKESYPTATESYPSHTESYAPQTESYPVPPPPAPVKTYDNSVPGRDKPSSTFDLAIDNYLKDFGYGNQGRGYDY